MKNIFSETINAVRAGSRFKVDFAARSLKVNKRYIIKNGNYDGELDIPEVENVVGYINALYSIYRHSIPTERSEQKRFRYFRALPENELLDEDMLYGESRDVAQISLELYVLCVILLNKLNWDELAPNKWYWQSQSTPSLIILKDWFNF